MRSLAIAFALIVSASSFACDQIRSEMKFKNLNGDFMTLTGTYNIDVDFIDLDTATCTREEGSTAYGIKKAVSVKISSGGKVVQSFESDLTVLGDSMIVARPASMISAGLLIEMSPKKQIVMFIDRGSIRPKVTL